MRELVDERQLQPNFPLMDFPSLAVPGSLGRLVIRFGDIIDALGDPWGEQERQGGVAAELHPEWLAYSSGPSLITQANVNRI